MCPCGSNQRFSQCCWPYIAGKSQAKTAQSLMRSRYAAYTRGNIAYIEATQNGPAAQNFDAQSAKKWALSAKWLGLKVVHCKQGLVEDTVGYVEFIASYKLNGQMQQIHEISEFHKIADRWLYFSNVLL